MAVSHKSLDEVLAELGSEPLTTNEQRVAATVYGELRRWDPTGDYRVHASADRETFHLAVIRDYAPKSSCGRMFHIKRLDCYGLENLLDLGVLVGQAVEEGKAL